MVPSRSVVGLALALVVSCGGPCAPSQQFDHTVLPRSTYFDVQMAVEVITLPDSGQPGRSVRWQRSEVTYSVDLPDYPSGYVAMVRHAVQWTGGLLGLRLVEVARGADLEVVPKRGNGALATAWTSSTGEIVQARVELGCCRLRPLWEDLMQAFGPMGDHADARSVFSQDLSRESPSMFDAWVLRALYSVPPGSGPDAVARALRRSRSFAT